MSKKDWKKQILRMKQIADQNLGRSEKSEVLTDDLQLLERQMNQIKDALQIIVKKLQACLIPYSGEADKRLRKLPEYALSSCFGDLAVTFNNETVFGKLFGLCSEAEMFVAKRLVHCTIDIEAKVIQPAQVLLERDIPAILKLRKQLANMTLDMDSAKSRHQALCKQTQNTTASVRLDAAREEFEEAEAKVEHCKDVFATEMYSFFAREEELCKMLLSLLESQSAYHQQSIDTLDRLIPLMREEIELMAARPVFGCSLEEHLRHSKREIASVIEDCVAEIIKRGLDVEGIFRIAPAASKVKELKAAFDANMVDVDEFEDIHCFCASLKHYLRELPQPIMTFELYNEWLQACQRPPDERLNALWVVVDKLPKFNYMNLRYVIKFLAKVTEQSDVNKMNATNLGIVIGPNLLWPPGENRSNVQHTSSLALIAEALIGSSEWFFPGDVEFPSAGSLASNASSSSSSDVSLQKSQAKSTFLAGNQSNSSASTALKTSSSAGSLLEQSSMLESKLTETVSYNVFKPPKKSKGAARAASPTPPGSEHQRSASISLLASNVSSTMKETTAVGAVKQDDVMDRKAAASARPRFPPPARPAQPQLDKTNILLQPLFPDKPKNSVTRHEQTDGALAHSQSSSSCDRISENDMLEIPENVSRKLVSRSLEDFVSESKHDEKYRSVHGDSCFESEKASDAEDGFNNRHHHHHQVPCTSSDCALDVASGFSSSRVDSQTRGTFCLDERASVEEVLPRFKPSVPVSSSESDSMESDSMKTSITSVSSVRSIDGNTSDLPLCASTSFKQGVPLHRKDFAGNDSSENRLQYVKGVCVSVEPPTPESSNHQHKELRVEPELSFIDKGNNATSAMKNRSETGQFMVYEDPRQRSFQSLSADNASNFARIENQLETNSALKEFAHGSGVTAIRSQCSKEATSDKDMVVGRGNVQVESKSGFSIGDYEDRSKTESGRSERSTVPFEARQQVNVVSKTGASKASGTTERCNVQVMTHKDCDEIVKIKSENLNTARVAVQLENNLGRQDESYKNLNENQLKQGAYTNVIKQQDICESDSAKFSSTSSATNSGVSANCNTMSSNASSSSLASCGTEGPSSTGYGPTGAVASSQAKQSDHKEMIQSLKLFFLSDKPPEVSPRGRSNSAVDCFRPGAGSELVQQSTESTRLEGGLTTRRSAGTLATESQSECGRRSSSSTQASAARFSSSSTDISSNRAYANASPREKFFASANPSAPVFCPSLVPETHGTEGTARSERSGVPPPSPARRNHPNDSGNESATTRRSKESSSNIVEDTRL